MAFRMSEQPRTIKIYNLLAGTNEFIGEGGTADRNRSHWSTSKTPSYTKSVSWQHHLACHIYI